MAKSSFPTGWLLLVVLLVGGGAGGWHFWQQSGDKLPELTTITVTRGALQQTVTATGGLQPVTSVEISSQVSGLVQEVLVDFNSVVKKGDVLARIDQATYQSKLAQARAQLTNTQASHDLTEYNTIRTRRLFEQNLVTEQELKQAEAQLKQADAQLLIQTAAMENAQIDLDRCTIYSPIDGVVIDRQTEVGKTVAASLNAPLLFLIVNDLTKMQISAGVAEADIGSVRVGQEVTFLVDAFPGRPFRGTVAQIRNAPVTQSNVVTYGAIIEVDNSDPARPLKPGMTANVSIITARRESVLRLANAALRVRIPEMLLPPVAGSNLARSVAAPAGTNTAGTANGAAVAPARGENPTPTPDPRGGAGGRGPGGRGGGGRGGRGGGVTTAGGDGTVLTTRTVYKSIGTAEKPRVEPVNVRLGITDGVNTEVVEGLVEGDTIVSSVNLPGAAPAVTQPSGGNPFQGRGGGGLGGGGGGGGGGRGGG